MKARAGRELLRFAAAEMFERGIDAGQIARELAVTRKSVNEWKRARRAGGLEALASKGPGGAQCRLNDAQLKALEQVPDEGPAARGWTEDQRWTLARVATPQVPQHVAVERDEEKVTIWAEETWPHIKALQPG